MLLTVSEFRRRVHDDMRGLVEELRSITGRFGDEEADAWGASLPVVAATFAHRDFAGLHLYLGDQGRLSLEYRLPSSSSWCDLVLLGSHGTRPSAVIVELKHWTTRGDRPGSVEGVMFRQGKNELHPSEQVRGYVSYCQRFHSAVHQTNAAVHGLVLFTKDRHFGSYSDAPNDRLFTEFPCFEGSHSAADPALVSFLRDRITEPDEHFANSFEQGVYQQDRGFVRQIGEQILTPGASPFELLDGQRLGFALCRSEIEKAIFSSDRKVLKTVVIVSGPPGSGKSVVAAKLWATLATDSRMDEGSFVLTTTSKSQETNWQDLFRQTGGHGAAGVVRPANVYAPVTTNQLGQLQHAHTGHFKDACDWRTSMATLRSLGQKLHMADDHLLVSIVDEAHALINPEFSDARGATGWPSTMGPQAYHIIRASTVSVFLLDEEQSFRERESTTIDMIERWSKELGAEVAPRISLAGSQFRCAGSTEYVSWVENMLSGSAASECAVTVDEWLAPEPASQSEGGRAVAQPGPVYSMEGARRAARRPNFEFSLVDDPWALESAVRERIQAGASGRLLGTYARKWVTKKSPSPRAVPPTLQDFQFSDAAGRRALWTRPWNFVPGGSDYTAFVQAPAGSAMADDPLGEVGCPYVIRGFDFDWIGVLWLSDLIWREDRWRVDPGHVHESGIERMRNRARREGDLDGPQHAALLRRVKQAYRIILTRAMKGVFVWCEDEETRQHLQSCLRPSLK
jgi:uncharacterized protein